MYSDFDNADEIRDKEKHRRIKNWGQLGGQFFFFFTTNYRINRKFMCMSVRLLTMKISARKFLQLLER